MYHLVQEDAECNNQYNNDQEEISALKKVKIK
jgi:hypothetical protein